MTRQTNFDPRWSRRGSVYVIVADGGRARIFKRSGRRSSPQSDYDPHLIEVERFARRLPARLARLARSERIEELVLIAEPRFLGVLRRELAEPLRHVVTRELARDLTAATPAPIARAAFPLESAPARQ